MAAPKSLGSQGTQDQLSQVVSELANQAGIEIGNGEGHEVEAEWPDDSIIELLLLQSYIWGNRSWNRVTEISNDLVFGAIQYACAMFGPKPDLGKMTQDERAARLEEIASELMNEDGVVELRRQGRPAEYLFQHRAPAGQRRHRRL